MTHNTVLEYLKNLKIESLFSESLGKTPIVIDSEALVEELVTLLRENHIQSVPVMTKKTKEVVGLVDCLDLVTLLLSVMPEKDQLSDPKALEMSFRAVNGKKVKEVCNLSGHNPYESVFIGDSIKTVIPYFAEGIHRVVAVDQHGDLKLTVSQSSVIHYILDFLQDDVVFGKKTLKDLGLAVDRVVGVKDTEKVVTVLKGIGKKGFSGVPVVDSHKGTLVGNFSATDVRQFVQDHLLSFNMEIKKWLEVHSPESLKPVSVHNDATLYSVCKLLSNGLHRVWVVDVENKPIGLVSYTDIYQLFRDHN